jgi:putative ABC transport system substrate-binding protein
VKRGVRGLLIRRGRWPDAEVVTSPQNPEHSRAVAWLGPAAAGLGIELEALALATRGYTELEARVGRVTGTGTAMLVLDSERAGEITLFALERRLPAVSFDHSFAAAGGLLTYGPNRVDVHRRTAAYVDRILRGARPGDLPVEEPARFELVVNLTTAKALGLTIPASVLARADEVVR